MLVFLIMLCVTVEAQPDTVTWTGNGTNNLWTNPKNWDHNMVPTKDHAVIIPGNSGEIETGGMIIYVKSLTLLDNNQSRGNITKIIPGRSSSSVIIEAGNEVIIGIGCTIMGTNGIGGNVRIVSSNGNFTNKGILQGGNGAGRKGVGGYVKIKAEKNITNWGTLQGGNGSGTAGGGFVTMHSRNGNIANEGILQGGNGGSKEGNGGYIGIETLVGDIMNKGTLQGGNGGGRIGIGGSVILQAWKKSIVNDGTLQGGNGGSSRVRGLIYSRGGDILVRAEKNITIKGSPTKIIQGGIGGPSLGRGGNVNIRANSGSIDLRGNTTIIIRAISGSIYLKGNIKLSTGVELKDITDPVAIIK